METNANACTQACDAIQADFRRLTGRYANVAIGFGNDAVADPTLSDIRALNIGCAARSYECEGHIDLAKPRAWQNMPPSLVRWAWASRGLCSIGGMAAPEHESKIKKLQHTKLGLHDSLPIMKPKDESLMEPSKDLPPRQH